MDTATRRYASFTLRILASLLDTLLSSVVLVPLYQIYFFLTSKQPIPLDLQEKLRHGQIPTLEEQAFLTHYIFLFIAESGVQILLIGGATLLFWVHRGATPGKMLLRMKIIDEKTGNLPSFRQSLLRSFGYILSLLPFCLGFIWIYFDKRNRGWHDYLAGTSVIKKNKNKK